MKIKIKTYANLGSTDQQIDLKKEISAEELLEKLNISKKRCL